MPTLLPSICIYISPYKPRSRLSRIDSNSVCLSLCCRSHRSHSLGYTRASDWTGDVRSFGTYNASAISRYCARHLFKRMIATGNDGCTGFLATMDRKRCCPVPNLRTALLISCRFDPYSNLELCHPTNSDLRQPYNLRVADA